MNEFLKSLQTYGMEGMGIEVEVEAYVDSECAEELIELDNLDAMCTAMESMSDAVMEGGLEMQTLALESAGFTLDTASGFTGELSNEAVGNMIKRGYYEVKIQVKKALQKIWKLIIAVVEHFVGSEGRLKSYGKLFKKYNDRLRKIHPKETRDGEDKEVTVRLWNEKNMLASVTLLKGLGGANGWIKALTTGFKAVDVKSGVENIVNGTIRLLAAGLAGMRRFAGASVNETREIIQEVRGLTQFTAEELEEYEKNLEERLKDLDLKDDLKDFINAVKEVDSEEMNIHSAKDMLLNVGTQSQTACNRDLKFKKDLLALRKVWDKKTGDWELKGPNEDANRISGVILRILNKCGVFITGYRMALSSYYKAIVSNMQGILSDMAKVIAKGTNVSAN